MRLVITGLLLLGLLAREGKGSNPRIYGGQEASDGQLPYQVSLQYDYQHFCAGSVLSANWILTAAHCVNGMTTDDLPYFTIEAGSVRNDLGLGQSRGVKLIFFHDEFPGLIGVHNDIAVLQLDNPLLLNNVVQPIKIPCDTPELSPGTELIVSGWGETEEGIKPNSLLFAYVRSITDSDCRVDWPWLTNDQHICTERPSDGTNAGPCFADSGGPLVATDRSVIIGIVSGGPPCYTTSPRYTQVSSYSTWIQLHTGGQAICCPSNSNCN